MKILIRIAMLIAVIIGLIGGYYWLMQRQAVSHQVPVEFQQHQILLDENENEYIRLTGRLVFDEGTFYIEREDKTRVAVASRQVDLYMFRDKQVTVGARFVDGKMDVFRVEEI
jgi:uncharacterized protein HemX